MKELNIELDMLTKHQVTLLFCAVNKILNETKSFSNVEELSAVLGHLNAYYTDLNEIR